MVSGVRKYTSSAAHTTYRLYVERNRRAIDNLPISGAGDTAAKRVRMRNLLNFRSSTDTVKYAVQSRWD